MAEYTDGSGRRKPSYFRPASAQQSEFSRPRYIDHAFVRDGGVCFQGLCFQGLPQTRQRLRLPALRILPRETRVSRLAQGRAA